MCCTRIRLGLRVRINIKIQKWIGHIVSKNLFAKITNTVYSRLVETRIFKSVQISMVEMLYNGYVEKIKMLKNVFHE